MTPFFMRNIYKITNKNSNSDQNNSKGLTHFFSIGKTLYSICMGKDKGGKRN